MERRWDLKHIQDCGFINELRLLYLDGRLNNRPKDDNWGDAFEHQIIQFFAVNVLGKMLNLSQSDILKLQKVALIHDWDKRVRMETDYFSEQEIKRSDNRLVEIDPDNNLLNATGTSFLKRYLDGKASYLEEIQFYIDDITKGSRIVGLDERIDDVSKNKPDLNSDLKMTELLGGKYWDVERRIGHEIEEKIGKQLLQNGINLSLASEIPNVIAMEIEKIKNG